MWDIPIITLTSSLWWLGPVETTPELGLEKTMIGSLLFPRLPGGCLVLTGLSTPTEAGGFHSQPTTGYLFALLKARVRRPLDVTSSGSHITLSTPCSHPCKQFSIDLSSNYLNDLNCGFGDPDESTSSLGARLTFVVFCVLIALYNNHLWRCVVNV